MIAPQTKEFQKKYLGHLKELKEDLKEYLKQVSEILEKKTYLQGGWPEEYWLYTKKYLQTEIESLKKHIEFFEKTKRWALNFPLFSIPMLFLLYGLFLAKTSPQKGQALPEGVAKIWSGCEKRFYPGVCFRHYCLVEEPSIIEISKHSWNHQGKGNYSTWLHCYPELT